MLCVSMRGAVARAKGGDWGVRRGPLIFAPSLSRARKPYRRTLVRGESLLEAGRLWRSGVVALQKCKLESTFATERRGLFLRCGEASLKQHTLQ